MSSNLVLPRNEVKLENVKVSVKQGCPPKMTSASKILPPKPETPRKESIPSVLEPEDNDIVLIPLRSPSKKDTKSQKNSQEESRVLSSNPSSQESKGRRKSLESTSHTS